MIWRYYFGVLEDSRALKVDCFHVHDNVLG
jgi:hypothetical protein